MNEVASDIRGIDRIQYDSFDELGSKLILMYQKFGKAKPPLDEYIANMKALFAKAMRLDRV